MSNKDYSDICKSCGLCCIYYPTISHKQTEYKGQWARIDKDETKVPRTLYKITRKPINTVYKNRDNIKGFIKDKPDETWKGFRRCIALKGTQCKSISCSVYENRPKVCSDFKPGDTTCNKIREWGRLDKI